jgi:lipid-A-disaccharide synthase
MTNNAKQPKHIVIIAGEASGDVLGADLLKTLQEQYPKASFSGVGGENIKKVCPSFHSIFNMNDIAVMGVAEILPSLPVILKRLKQAKNYIKEQQPDLVITIDAPDFNFRVVRAVKPYCTNTKFIHYVAPTVWAWREGRAAKLAKLYDGLLCLLPFEPLYFEKYGLKTQYIGHPALKEAKPYFEKEKPRDAENTIAILFGSRKSEFKRHSEIIIEAMRKIAAKRPETKFIIPYVEHLKEAIQNALNEHSEIKYELVPAAQRYDAYHRSGYAIAVSGTVGLELALMGVPHLICYRFGWLTYQLAKRLVKTPYAHLANIVLNKPVIPELIQEKCTADEIAKVFDDCNARLLTTDIDQIRCIFDHNKIFPF